MLLCLNSMIVTTHVPITYPGYDPAMNMGGSVSGILRGSASTDSTKPESDSYSTIAGAEYSAETTPQSIPSPASPGTGSGCSTPGPGPITMYQKDVVYRDPLAAFHLHKALQDADGRCLKPNGQCKQTGTEALEREEKEEEELGVLLISESDDSGSNSGSENSDTGLGDHDSAEDSNYSPLPDSPAPGDDESDYTSTGLMHMVFQQARTDYLLDFERRKYKAEKNARTQHHSVRHSSTEARVFPRVFTAYVYTGRCGNSERITDGDEPQGMLGKGRDIFMRAWSKNEEQISKESDLVGNEEEAAYDADDDLESELEGWI
ncbi:hypothetical protein BGX38DRAFT_1220634 [Terfezia claveryi]|nr:hypothetical protein BGX38DRAFT_1220634 [Terfezia claveryi]